MAVPFLPQFQPPRSAAHPAVLGCHTPLGRAMPSTTGKALDATVLYMTTANPISVRWLNLCTISILMKWKIPNLLHSKLMTRLVPSEVFSRHLKNNRTKQEKETAIHSVSLLSQHQDPYF